MSKVWVITGLCADYYCGCGEGHLIGATLNHDIVEGLVTAVKGIAHSYGSDRWYSDYSDVHVTELELDLVYPRDLPGAISNTQNTDRTQDDGKSLGT